MRLLCKTLLNRRIAYLAAIMSAVGLTAQAQTTTPNVKIDILGDCLLYTSDAADE